MINVYLRDRTLIAHDKGDKLFTTDHGRGWEKVAVIKDSVNYEPVIERLKKQYNAAEVVKECTTRARWGWKYFTPEEKAKLVEASRAANTGKIVSTDTKTKMANAKRGKASNALGSRKSVMSKALVSIARMGNSTVTGLTWCHCPTTGKEGRKRELPDGWRWGRSPEVKDYLRRY